jgi:methionyl-tRNA formyltransferase
VPLAHNISICLALLCNALQPAFLEAVTAMQPDLAVTAAYGNMLPTAFLNIPKHGVLNIHPSLLPQYRGAAPVQRAVQVSSTGGQHQCSEQYR